MQWLTATIGLFQSCATVRATTATDTRGAAIPGPITCSKINQHTHIQQQQTYSQQLDLTRTYLFNLPCCSTVNVTYIPSSNIL